MSVHVLRCPNCGADLDVADGIVAIRCRYCRTPCRVDWRGADPLLTREAQEFVEALNAIDLDALESGLDELNAMLDGKLPISTHRDTVGRMNRDAVYDDLAAQIINSGIADDLLVGISEALRELPADSNDPHIALTRSLCERLAARVRLGVANPGHAGGGGNAPANPPVAIKRRINQSKAPKNSTPAAQVPEDKAARLARIKALLLQARAEYEAYSNERGEDLSEYEREHCWRLCKQKIKASGTAVSYRAVCDDFRREREKERKRNRKRHEQQEQKWQVALLENWKAVEQRQDPEWQRQEAERKAREVALWEERERQRREEERLEQLKSEILAEEASRRTSLEKERVKARLRAEMQQRGEIPPDEPKTD